MRNERRRSTARISPLLTGCNAGGGLPTEITFPDEGILLAPGVHCATIVKIERISIVSNTATDTMEEIRRLARGILADQTYKTGYSVLEAFVTHSSALPSQNTTPQH